MSKWFEFEYEEARDLFSSPARYSVIKLFQLLVRIFFRLLQGIFRVGVALIYRVYGYVIRDGRGLFVIILIFQWIRKRLK